MPAKEGLTVAAGGFPLKPDRMEGRSRLSRACCRRLSCGEYAFPQGYHRVLETLAERIEDPELKANRPRVRTHGHTHHRGTLIRVL